MSFTGGNGGGDSKGNALWVDGEGGPGEWLWKIEEGSGMWIGVAEEARFGPGYQLKVSSLISSIFVKVASAGVAVRGSWQPLRRLVSCYRALGAKVCDRRQCWHEGSMRVLKYGFVSCCKGGDCGRINSGFFPTQRQRARRRVQHLRLDRRQDQTCCVSWQFRPGEAFTISSWWCFVW